MLRLFRFWLIVGVLVSPVIGCGSSGDEVPRTAEGLVPLPGAAGSQPGGAEGRIPEAEQGKREAEGLSTARTSRRRAWKDISMSEQTRPSSASGRRRMMLALAVAVLAPPGPFPGADRTIRGELAAITTDQEPSGV